MKRYKMSDKKSKNVFTKHALRVHPKNGLAAASYIMRGGIRL